MNQEPNNRIGLALGNEIAGRLRTSQDPKLYVAPLLPSADNQKSPRFLFAMLGVLALAENATCSYVMCLHPQLYSRTFRSDIVEGIGGWAVNSGSPMSLSDVLVFSRERDRFCGHWKDRMDRQGGQAIYMAVERKYSEVFYLLQELRALEYATMCGRTPESGLHGPDWAIKDAAAMIDCGLLWVIGSNDRSEANLKLIAPIVYAVTEAVRRVCEGHLTD
jgi:hypothetical protein